MWVRAPVREAHGNVPRVAHDVLVGHHEALHAPSLPPDDHERTADLATDLATDLALVHPGRSARDHDCGELTKVDRAAAPLQVARDGRWGSVKRWAGNRARAACESERVAKDGNQCDAAMERHGGLLAGIGSARLSPSIGHPSGSVAWRGLPSILAVRCL